MIRALILALLLLAWPAGAQFFSPVPQAQFAPNATGRSLIFTSASSQYLSITGNAGANQRKFTVAFWWKATTASGTFLNLWDGGSFDVNDVVISLGFSSPGGFRFLTDNSSGFTTTDKRQATYPPDTSQWHHYAFAVDTTQATAANRVRIYVDGAEITTFTSNTIAAQNTNFTTNSATTQTLGAFQETGLNSFINGKMAEFYYIDGQQLAPSSFITGTPGQPKAFSGTYAGAFDAYLNFSNPASTATLGADASGEGNNWTLNNMTTSNSSTDFP